MSDKQHYIVTITRIGYGVRDLMVSATSKEEAERLADEVAGDFEYNEHSAEYKYEVNEASNTRKAEKEALERSATFMSKKLLKLVMDDKLSPADKLNAMEVEQFKQESEYARIQPTDRIDTCSTCIYHYIDNDRSIMCGHSTPFKTTLGAGCGEYSYGGKED